MKRKNLRITAMLVAFIMVFMSFSLTINSIELNDTIVEDVSKREANVKHFANPDGSYTAIVYGTAVHRKDAQGIWQDIDNRMSENETENKQAYITSDGRAIFAKKVNDSDTQIYELSENGYSIKLSFDNESIKNTTAKLSNHAEKYTPSPEDTIETQYKKVKEIDNSTTLTYNNILKGVDLEYLLSSNSVKENIIINKLQDAYSFSFVYELDGLTATLLEGGSVILADESSGEPIYRIPVPFMYDANGEMSDDVAYGLTDMGEGKYTLTVTADSAWINAEERELPVTIDPTVSLNEDSIYFTYIDEENPSSNYSGSAIVTYSKIAMAKIYSMPSIPDNALIVTATLGMSYTSSVSGTHSIGLYRIYGSWDDYDITWNDLNNIEPSVTMSSTAYDTKSFSGSASVSFNAMTLARQWYESTTEFGFALKYTGDEDCNIYINTSSVTLTIGYDLVDLPLANGTYYIRNVGQNAYLQEDDDTSIGASGYELWNADGTSQQHWKIKYIHNGYYLITSTHNNYALEKYTYSSGDVKLLSMPYTENKTSQQWYITTTTEGYIKISPHGTISEFLTSFSSGTNDAPTVDITTAQDDSSDEWIINSNISIISSVSYTLPSVSEHLCIPSAITTVARYWAEKNNYTGFRCIGDEAHAARATELQNYMKTELSIVVNNTEQGHTSNVNIPPACNTFVHTSEGTTYRLNATNRYSSAFDWDTIKNEIDNERPLLLGFNNSSISPYTSHMTVCVGYEEINNKKYVFLCDAHNVDEDDKYQRVEFNTTYNDFISLINIEIL